MEHRLDNQPWTMPQVLHHACGCNTCQLLPPRPGEAEREPETLDNGELQVLLLAARQAGALLDQNRERLAAQRAAVTKGFHEAESSLQALGRFAARGSLRTAARAHQLVERRHADDGAEDRRRHPRWMRALPWLVVPVVGAFDGWYFASVFSFLANTDESDPVAFLPGAGLAAMLLIAGILLAEPVVRWKNNLERAAEDDQRTRRRPRWWPRHRAGDLPRPVWRLALFAMALVVTTIVTWAVVRTWNELDNTTYYPEWGVALLLLTLTAGAVASKVLARNPFADRAREATRELAKAEKTWAGLTREAQERLEGHAHTWHEPHATVEEIWGQIRLLYAGAWESFILRARIARGDAGPLPPALAASPRPDRAADGLGDLHGPALPDLDEFAPLFDRVRHPAPEVGLLRHACDVLGAYDPAVLRTRREDLLADLNRQFTTEQEPT